MRIEDVEVSAVMFGAELRPGARVHLGAVGKRRGTAFFEITAQGRRAAALVVTVAGATRPSDVWSAWALTLEWFGFTVSCDAAYSARVAALGAREAADIAKNTKAYRQRARIARRLAAA